MPPCGTMQGPGQGICLIAALARNRVIGRDGTLPWRLPSDLKRFKDLTLGHPVIMGRKTWDAIHSSLGRALTGRANIVISRSGSIEFAGARLTDSLQGALAAARMSLGGEQCFIIGGAQVYELSLPLAGWMYLTEIDADVEGDAFFPIFDREDWQVCSREQGPANERPSYEFVTYRRRD